jgi:hypothetical protein
MSSQEQVQGKNEIKCSSCGKIMSLSSEEWTMCAYDYRRCGFSGCQECVAAHIKSCPQKDKSDQEVFPESFDIEQQVCNQCDGGSLYQKKIMTDSTMVREVYLVEVLDTTKYVCPDCGDTREEFGFNQWVQVQRAGQIRADILKGVSVPVEAQDWLAWAIRYYKIE